MIKLELPGLKLVLLVTGLVLPFLTVAQNFHRDTSYTFHSAYQKYVERYPDITKADSMPSGLVDKKLNLWYKNTGQRNLSLDVFYPKNKNSEVLPAVIMIHGGGWISGDKSLLHPLAAHVADQQYVVITPEYRLSPEAKYPAAIYDVNSAIKWVKDQANRFDINPGKVSILGSSAGGQLAALAAATAGNPNFEDPADTSETSTTVQALVDVDGVLAFIHPVSEEGKSAGLWLGGDKKKARKTWMEASPLTHAGPCMPPTLFIGSSNPRFLAGRIDMAEILQTHNIYTRTHLFEEAPHSFWLFHPWFEPTLEQVSEFLDKVLKD